MRFEQAKSPSYRYFRLHPALATCFDELVKHEMRWLPGKFILNVSPSSYTQSLSITTILVVSIWGLGLLASLD